eukprot:30914-Pelagococcus_subviridis.AAC.2
MSRSERSRKQHRKRRFERINHHSDGPKKPPTPPLHPPLSSPCNRASSGAMISRNPTGLSTCSQCPAFASS